MTNAVIQESAEPEPTLERAPDATSPGPPAWGMLQRVLFRFGLVYFLLYAHPAPLSYLPTPSGVAAIFQYSADWVTEADFVSPALSDYRTWYVRQERWIVDGLASGVFGIESVLDRPYGSGDPLYSYIRLLVHVAVAAFVCALWSWTSRNDRGYPRLGAWLLIGLRFYVGFAMLSYGLSKVLPTQFPPWLRLDRLLAPWGDSSPMNVLWSTMSSSEMYTRFGGAGEVIAGCLLVFRRTSTLGALVAAGVMTNVVAMNFCFDVPVKLYSSHLLLASVAIAAPDIRRLFDVLIWNRPASPRDMRYPHHPITGTILKLFVVASFVVPGIRSRMERMATYDDLPPYFGIWDVERFEVNGELCPPIATDGGLWKHLVVDRGGRCSVHRQDGTRMRQRLEHQEDGSVTLESSSEWEPEIIDGELVLTGQFGWRFLADLGDESSTLQQENREPRLRWRLRRMDLSGAAEASEAVHRGSEPDSDQTTAPWIGSWQTESREILSPSYTPRFQPAPAHFTSLEFVADGTLWVTLPSGRVDTFRWETTDDERSTLRLTARGEFEITESSGTMQLHGTFRGHALEASLAARDLNEFQILNRGFHWVSPIPWNRY
ncbi:MAG: hypothetical protein AAGG01_00045 [Planctomycetota bacterium]